jgi:hypothetical protein
VSIRERSAWVPLMIPQGVGGRDHLSWVCSALSPEFADRLDAMSIERVAAEEVAAFAEASVRDSIPILAIRRARLRLWEWALGRYGRRSMTR